jgi:hypothetical protein
VVHHVGPSRLQNLESAIHPAAEIGRQDLDPRGRRQLSGALDARDEVGGPAVAQVVAIDAGDDDVLSGATPRSCAPRFSGSSASSGSGTAMADVAERAAPRALVAHDHERRGAVAEALADVRAARLLAHRVQPVFAQDLLDLVEAARRGAGLDAIQSGFFSVSAATILIGMRAVLASAFCLARGS